MVGAGVGTPLLPSGGVLLQIPHQLKHGAEVQVSQWAIRARRFALPRRFLVPTTLLLHRHIIQLQWGVAGVVGGQQGDADKKNQKNDIKYTSMSPPDEPSI